MAADGQGVYLHARPDCAKAWDRAADALSSSGVVVIPTEPDPVEHDALRLQKTRQNRVETLSGCDALLLLPSHEGQAVDADLVVVGHPAAQGRSGLNMTGGMVPVPPPFPD